MRALALTVLIFAGFGSGGAAAQDLAPQAAVDQVARWNACYKETRLIYRTRNMSQDGYRQIIKEARRAHMGDCMTRAMPPRSIAISNVDGRRMPSTIAGWAANP